MSVYFITGPEGSGTTALVRALCNHPRVVKGDAARYGHHVLRGAAAAQVIPVEQMSASRAGRVDVGDWPAARCRIRDSASAFFAAQPHARAIFFKYSTPAFRPKLWPVFLPLFDLAEFRVIVVWRAPFDTVFSAFRRFERAEGRRAAGLLAAIGSYAAAVRHIRGQLRQSPPDRYCTVKYEDLVGRPEATLRRLSAFSDLDYRPAEELLPGSGFSNENGKWRRALLRALTGRPTEAAGSGRVE